MLAKAEKRWLTPTRCLLALALWLPIWGGGCQNTGGKIQSDDPVLAEFVRLILPAEIEIQHYLTKPFDFAGTGNADGLEVIIAARDSFGDKVKCVGTFHFELYTMRMASGDKLGKQIGSWPVKINSGKTLAQYWDRYSHYYVFELKLRSGTLPPGRYILNARLVTPTGDKLYDTYEFEHPTPP